MFFFLVLLSASYWYCLPVLTQSLIGYSELRVYDFLFLILFVVLFTNHSTSLNVFFKKDRVGRWLFRFALWASITTPVSLLWSVLISKPTGALVTLIFLFHLWGFILAYAAFRLFVTTQKQCIYLLDVFLLIGTVQGILICLQAAGMLPTFWSSLYSAYGNLSPSGTLGPNRVLPGHAMILVLSVTILYWKNALLLGIRRIWLATLAGFTSLLALGVTGSRTSWVTASIFLILILLFRKKTSNAPVVLLSLLLISGILFAVPDSIGDRIELMYELKFSGKLEHAIDEDALSQFQSIDSGRFKFWIGGLKVLFENPWLIPFGGGFNNYRHAVGFGVSAHNMYITLIGELGVVGLYFYLQWLNAIRIQSAALVRMGTLKKNNSRKMFLPVGIESLIFALMFSLMGGEILYSYRPSFAFLGMFLLLASILNNPVLIFEKVPKYASIKKPSVQFIHI